MGPRPTEETRLTSQSGSSILGGKSGTFYGSFADDDEENKSLSGMLDCGNTNTSYTASERHTMNDPSLAFIIEEETKQVKAAAATDDAQSGSGDVSKTENEFGDF